MSDGAYWLKIYRIMICMGIIGVIGLLALIYWISCHITIGWK